MTVKHKISRMYSSVTAPDGAVDKCLESMETQKVVHLPVKRILLAAACVTLIMAVLIPTVGASKLFSAYDSLDEYAQTLPYPEKQSTDNGLLSQSSSVAAGEKTVAELQGLKITAQQSFYDGTMVCISFVGEYDGEYNDAFRFDYIDTEKGEEFVVDSHSVMPLYQASFFMIKTEDKFSGVLRLPYDSEKSEVNVSIDIPYLQVSGADDEEIGVINGNFVFDLTVRKSEDVLTYTGDECSNEIYIQQIVSSAAGFKLVYFVPDSELTEGANIQPVITDGYGNPVKLIEGRQAEAEGGVLKIWRCEATTADNVNVTLYDKNNTDGCEQAVCTVAEFTDIKLY